MAKHLHLALRGKVGQARPLGPTGPHATLLRNALCAIQHQQSLVTRNRRWVLASLGTGLSLPLALAAWVRWSHWPDPQPQPLFADADALVVLGGGDQARWRKALALAADYPNLPVVVTGDQNSIVNALLTHGLPAGRIVHEEFATTTVENALLTAPLLDRLAARRVILVTNWYHAPRALATFRKFQPGREFAVAISLKQNLPWDPNSQRRERLAAIYNLLRHGVWSWGGR